MSAANFAGIEICTVSAAVAGGAQIQNRLAHADDNAAAIPSRELGKLLYGKDSVFARNPTPEQVSLIKVGDGEGQAERSRNCHMAYLFGRNYSTVGAVNFFLSSQGIRL